jgi:hypothetical protein
VVYGGNPEFTLQNAGELRLTVDEWNVLKDALFLEPQHRISIEEMPSDSRRDPEKTEIPDTAG